jgi:(p)ppGpp synthase/HD superfamily hydrolase
MTKPDLIARAQAFATAAHASIDQRRKFSGEPYIGHPANVAAIVASVPDATPAMIAAAWLHDVVEDTPITLEQIRREFGAEVGRLVDEVTNVAKPENGNRAARKAMNRLHSAAASSDGQTVKLSDVISNLSTIGQADPAFAALFVGEKKALLEVLTKGNATLRERASSIVRAWERQATATAALAGRDPTDWQRAAILDGMDAVLEQGN